MIVEVFGVPGAGKSTVVREVARRDRVDARFVIDRPPTRTRLSRAKRAFHRVATRQESDVSLVSKLAADNPRLFTEFERGLLADDRARSQQHWANLFSWMLRYRRSVRGHEGLVVVDAGWCQRAATQFVLADQGLDLVEPLLSSMPLPDAAVSVSVPVERSLDRMSQRGFLPRRLAGEEDHLVSEAITRSRQAVARATDWLERRDIPVLRLQDGPMGSRAHDLEAFLTRLRRADRALPASDHETGDLPANTSPDPFPPRRGAGS